MPTTKPIKSPARNVLGRPLETCGCEPMTGFYRDGCCNTGPDDYGVHTICCIVDAPFLAASKALGNDLSTPMPEYNFQASTPETAGASAPPAGSPSSKPEPPAPSSSKPPTRTPSKSSPLTSSSSTPSSLPDSTNGSS